MIDADGSSATVALLNGRTVHLRIVGPAVDIEVGAYHTVAELLSAATVVPTARVA